VSAVVTLDEPRGTIRDVRLTLANSAPTVVRARGAEQALRGIRPSKAALAEAAETASREASPRDSWRANRDYRLVLIRTLTRRAVATAYDRASAGNGARP